MTKIDLSPLEDTIRNLREENADLRARCTERDIAAQYAESEERRLREENAKVREVNAEQAKHIGILTAQRDEARENEEKWRARVLDLEGRLMAAQQQRMARSGE